MHSHIVTQYTKWYWAFNSWMKVLLIHLTLHAVFVCDASLSILPLLAGVAGWGITWYINDTFIPVIRVTRGYTYTFLVYGGQDSTLPARYHPFYITDSPTGGRLANSPEEVNGPQHNHTLHIIL